MADKIKFALALVLLAAGVAGFYYLAGQASYLRLLAVLAGVGCSAAVAWQTNPGRRFFDFGREAVVEAKKVVWPTKKETLQITGMVFIFVIVMAAFLWITDKGLEWALYDLILGWKKS